jgi:hypothetical protein
MARTKLVEYSEYFMLALCWVLFGYLVYFYFPTNWTHFSSLADAFLEGLTSISGFTHDMAKVGDKYYVPFGPFPAVFLMPFRLISQTISESYVQVLLLGLFLFLACRITKSYAIGRRDSLFLVTMLVLGSPSFVVICEAKSWYFSQVVAATCLLGALYFWKVRNNLIAVGVLVAGALATRPTSSVIALPLLIYLSVSSPRRISDVGKIMIPIATTMILLLSYNYFRFGNISESGYNLADVGGYVAPARNFGLFGFEHFPKNFYYYFLASFEPIIDPGGTMVFPFIKSNPWGLSLFLTSPAFFFLLRNRLQGAEEKVLAATAMICLLLLMTYYHTGWMQFGTRYVFDLLPVLWVLICSMRRGRPLQSSLRWLVIASALFNLYNYFVITFQWAA